MCTAETEASLARYRCFVAGLAVLLYIAGSPAATGQAATVLSGSYNESGTRTDCNSSNTPTPWTQVGTIAITVSPPFTSLPAGGSVTGTFTYSGTDHGCSTQPVGGQGSVTGVVSASGQLTLILTEPVAGCSLTGQGTIDDASGSIPAACLDHPGSGTFDVTSRSSPSGGSGAPCINFPSGFVPFSSISYVTAANFAGDHLVVGVPAPGAFSTIGNIPLPAFANQQFCNSQVQLAPQQFYPAVYVPTADESGGNFGAFTGVLVDPATNQPYPNGIIPSNQLGSVFAWRIGSAQVAPANPNWTATASMPGSQWGQAMVLLPSGIALIVGTDGSAYLYDPATGTFSSTGKMMAHHGTYVNALLLNNGKVLVVGGETAPSIAELYDPVTGMFSLTGPPGSGHGKYGTATLLSDGRVLSVGGLSQIVESVDSGADIYNPATGTFMAAGSMFANRANHTATLLTDGRVLIAGGSPHMPVEQNGVPAYNSAEIFDPKTATFFQTGTMQEPRGNFMSVLLPNGQVLLAGGYGANASQTAELFNPVSGAFSQTGEMNAQRGLGTATLLPSGQVLMAGGLGDNSIATNTTELYSPATGTFTQSGNMLSPRDNHAALLLLNGAVLVTGGNVNNYFNVPTLASAEIYTPTVEGLVTSQTGLTFRVAQGSAAITPQQVAVLSNTDTIPWTVSTHTYQGGNWLVVAPSSGNSVPGATPAILTIAANPAGLPVQDYYGTVTLTPTDGKHPPVSISIVLNIVPAGTAAPPVVSPAGLVFLGAPGATLKPQTFAITNLTSSPLTFSGAGSTAPKWFAFAPTNGTVNAGQTSTVTVTPNITGLTGGVFPGSIKLTFGDGSTQIVNLLLVLSTSASTSNAPVRPAATPPACTATKLLPVFTTLGTGFNSLAAWATPIIVEVVDDCGNAINSGSVIVSFSDGDPAIALLSTGIGNWAGTWVPQNKASGFTARADAQSSPLTGSVAVTGQVSSNPTVPVVSKGGVVSSGDYAGAPALGLLVSIFGSGLADSGVSAPVPLPPQLGTTQVILGGEALPLLYVSDSVINVLIPYDLPVNTSTQLVVQRANAISVPVTTAIFNASPSVLSTAATGSGQGHVYVIGAGGIETLADQNHPAKAGDNVVIYCIGLGAVSPGITGGQLALSDPLSKATVPVTVTFGTQTVIAGFAGLTPDETGLYQINTSIPAGVMPGNQVPVTIAAGGASSSAQIFMAVQ